MAIVMAQEWQWQWLWQQCSAACSTGKNSAAFTLIQVFLPPACSCGTCEWWWQWHSAGAHDGGKGGINSTDGNSCIANLCNWLL